MPYQPKIVDSKKKLYDLNDVLTFGKYKGSKIKKVLEFDPDYIDWCIYKEIFDVTADVIDEVEAIMRDNLLDSYIG